MDARCLIDSALKDFCEITQKPENFLKYSIVQVALYIVL